MALRFDPEPCAAVDEMFAQEATGDSSMEHLAERLDHWFNELEKKPQPTMVRRRYLRPPGLWMITVPRSGDQDDWAILWDLQDGDVWIRYVGPASFA